MKYFNKLCLPAIILSSVFCTSITLADDNNMRPKMTAEKCLLTKSTQAPGNKYDALIGVKSINIYGEWQIQQGGNTDDGKFPVRESMVSFNFNDDTTDAPNIQTVGDELFKTLQSTTLLSKAGKPIDIKTFEGDTLQNIYTHTFLQNTPGRELKMSAVHTVAQYVDHWYSKDVVVDFAVVDKTPMGSSQVKGRFVFKCNAYDEAVETLKK